MLILLTRFPLQTWPTHAHRQVISLWYWHLMEEMSLSTGVSCWIIKGRDQCTVWLRTMSSLQCFDTGGWVTRTSSRQHCAIYSQIYSFEICAFSALTLLVGHQEEHPACQKTEWWGAGVVICLDWEYEMQMICIWSSWCHCHLIISCFIKIQIGLTFCCQLTQVVLEKRPLNGFLSVSFETCRERDLTVQPVNDTRTMLDTVGKCKRVVTACAKTWITTAWYNWRKNEGEGYKSSEKNAPAEWRGGKQKLHGSKTRISKHNRLES